jgi:hypothetical protein
MRYLIVSSNAPPGYAGMDRPLVGMQDDVPDELVLRGAALDDLPPAQAEAGHRRFLVELREHGFPGYELLGLGESPDPAWEFLGFDVGETTKRAWSALAHRAALGLPAPRLNSHGLFDDRAEAEQFLRAYLESDDPDRGWTADGWEDRPASYAVVPIQRLRF